MEIKDAEYILLQITIYNLNEQKQQESNDGREGINVHMALNKIKTRWNCQDTKTDQDPTRFGKHFSF